MTEGRAPVVILCGSGRLALAIEQRLSSAGSRVEWLADAGEFASIPPPQLESASVLILAGDDDAGNVDRALTMRRIRPDLPLVVRLFEPPLVTYLTSTLSKVMVLSMSATAAPAFSEAALLAIAERSDEASSSSRPARATPTGRSRLRPDRVLLTSLAILVVLVVAATLFFASALGLSVIDALYFSWTTITTVGYGDITLKNASSGAKIAGMVLMFAGSAFMALLFAFFTGWVVTRRFDVLRGRVRVGGRGHVVIAGGGNTGFRVAQLLSGKGHRVVLIERNSESRHVDELRRAGHQVVIADATSDDVLDLVAVPRAAVVLALTDSDATNLHIALLVRASSRGVRVIMRTASPELSAHVSEKGDAVAISSLAAAADAFSRAALAMCGPRAVAGSR